MDRNSAENSFGGVPLVVNPEVSDFIMIESIEVENFRCFKKINVSNLRRINVIVGKNAAGKTALLEGIKLGLEGTPGIVPWLNTYRSIQTFIPPNASNEQFQGAFLDFFHGFDPQLTISTLITDSTNNTASVRVYFDQGAAVTTQPSLGFKVGPAGTAAGPPLTIIPIAFVRKDFRGQNSTLFITVDQNGQLQIQAGKALGLVSGFFSNAYFGVPQENAVWLSALSVEKRSEEVIEALQRHFPFIRGVTSETPFVGGGTVYVDVPSLPRKLPLSLVSGGISRLFTLLLAVVTFKGGVVLIDEVENGIFHDQYTLIWKTLADLAKHHGTQLFVSTHSYECLRALVPTIKEDEKDFCFLRVEKENGKSGVAQFSGHDVEAALAKGADVREQ